MNPYDHFKDQLKNYQVETDKDKLWAHTRHAIPDRQRRRGFILLLLGTFLLLSGSWLIHRSSAGAWPFHHQKASHQSQQPATSITHLETELTNTHQSNTSHAPDDDVTSNPPSSNKSSGFSFSHKQNNELETSGSGGANKQAEHVQDKNASTISNTEMKDHSTQKSPSVSAASQASLTSTTITSTEVSSAGPLTGADEAGTLTSAFSLRNTYLTEELNTISFPALSLESPQRMTPTLSIIPSSAPRRLFGLQFFQGIGWTTMQIKTDHPEWSSLTHQLESQSMSLENYSTSLHATYNLSGNLLLTGGIQYSVLHTSLEYQKYTGEHITVPGVTTIIIDENGQIQNLHGDVEAYRESIIHSTRYTTLKRLDLELSLQWAIMKTRRADVNIWAKAGYNVLFQSKGTTLNSDNQLVPFDTNDDLYTLTSPWTYGLGIGTNYRITPQWSLMGRFGYERLNYTHGLYHDEISIHHQIYSLSLGMGFLF